MKISSPLIPTLLLLALALCAYMVHATDEVKDPSDAREALSMRHRRAAANRRKIRARQRKPQAVNTNLVDMLPDTFFEKFGYLGKSTSDVQHSPASRRRAIRDFQRMAHLVVTGRLDAATLKKMKQPRCGMPDMTPPEVMVPPGVSLDPGSNPQNFYVPGYKWKKTGLTWRAHNYSPDMGSGSQRRAFSQAFEHWSDVTPLTFQEIGGGDADIDIEFAYGQHSDGAGNAFDGAGGTLAHAFYPENGDTHFDESEEWTENTERGTNLMIVAAHEFGHALGLGHSNVDGALMAPYYQGYDPSFQLHDDDVRAIQSLYGGTARPMDPPTTTRRPTRPGKTTTTPRPTPSTTPRPGKKPNSCTSKFDAMLQAHDYRIYVFKAQWVWRLNEWAVDDGFPILNRKVYDNPPINIGAAVYSWKTRYTYFFKGTKVWKYYGFQKIERKVIQSTGYPAGPMAAFIDRYGKIFLLKGAEYWEFSEDRMDVVSTKGKPIAAMWPGVPPNIEAAVRLRDGYIYFIKGSKYRKFDEYYKRVVSGYPKLKDAPWMGPKCGGTYVPK